MEDTSAKESGILIVDDDPAVRDFLEKFLKQKGYLKIQAVEGAEEALKIIVEEEVKLVLLDIKLRGANGVDVLRKIKETNKDIGVIMITGFPDEKTGQEAMELGAHDYIMKPFDLAYLELSVFSKIAKML